MFKLKDGPPTEVKSGVSCFETKFTRLKVFVANMHFELVQLEYFLELYLVIKLLQNPASVEFLLDREKAL